MLLRILAVFILFIALFEWATHVPLTWAAPGQWPPSVPLSQFTVGSIMAKQVVLPSFTESGVVIWDKSQGLPGMPYLVYQDAKQNLRTKALIFDGGSGCQVSAGEYPCPRDIDEVEYAHTNTSPLPSGSVVSVTGQQDDQGVFVTGYTPTTTPANMLIAEAHRGDTVRLSNGFVFTVLNETSDPRCTLGAGCSDGGISQVLLRLGNGTATTTRVVLPGSLSLFNGTFISPLSSAGDLYTFLIVAER